VQPSASGTKGPTEAAQRGHVGKRSVVIVVKQAGQKRFRSLVDRPHATQIPG
jgi:hypothetical protein